MKEFILDFLTNVVIAIKYGLGIPVMIITLILCWVGPFTLAVGGTPWCLFLYLITLPLATTIWRSIDKWFS
jgi:hypothetical protein